MDNVHPNPLRRSPRATFEHWHPQEASQSRHVDGGTETDVPVSSSLDKPASAHVGPMPQTRYKASYSFRERLQPSQTYDPLCPIPLPVVSSNPRRLPTRLKSDRLDRRFPPHLHRRRISLETIDSVATTPLGPDDDEESSDHSEEDTSLQYVSTLEEDPHTTPVPSSTQSTASSVHSSTLSSQPSYTHTTKSVNGKVPVPHSPISLFQKLTNRKDSLTSVPDRLIIERTVSINHSSADCSSSQLNPSASNQSLSYGQPFDARQFREERRPSGSSSEWSASSFDITTLTEAELKKCKKKGINPSLYAEMKAARRGKWTSPIAGNSFL